MLRYNTKPVKPDDFETRVQPSRDAVQAAIDAGTKPTFDATVWGGYKDRLSAAQFRKCGYCEIMTEVGSHSDVEHYRPKSEIGQLRAAGEERVNVTNVRGRSVPARSAQGYWWTAYSWENWLLSCKVCNQRWKQTLFPIEGDDVRRLPPRPEDKETPLLLHPFQGRRPEKHLAFGKLGEIMPRRGSPFGRATIEVCGLDRPGLRESRFEKAEEMFDLINELEDAEDEALDRAYRRIWRKGRESVAHAGMARAIFEAEVPMTWAELDELVRSLGE